MKRELTSIVAAAAFAAFAAGSAMAQSGGVDKAVGGYTWDEAAKEADGTKNFHSNDGVLTFAIVTHTAGNGFFDPVYVGATVAGNMIGANILLLGSAGYLAFAGPVGGSADLSDTWAGDFSVGSAPTADNSLAGAEVDVLPSTAIGPATSEAIARTRAANATAVMLDNTDNSLELNLNLLVDADDVANGQSVDITVNGEITLLYSVLLDD